MDFFSRQGVHKVRVLLKKIITLLVFEIEIICKNVIKLNVPTFKYSC